MISAAIERLHQYKMDVIFVVYPTKRNNENEDEDEDECYQVIIFNKKTKDFYLFF
jgi:hypothetical protein